MYAHTYSFVFVCVGDTAKQEISRHTHTHTFNAANVVAAVAANVDVVFIYLRWA